MTSSTPEQYRGTSAQSAETSSAGTGASASPAGAVSPAASGSDAGAEPETATFVAAGSSSSAQSPARSGGAGADPTRSAVRTSLAQRFAAARDTGSGDEAVTAQGGGVRRSPASPAEASRTQAVPAPQPATGWAEYSRQTAASAGTPAAAPRRPAPQAGAQHAGAPQAAPQQARPAAAPAGPRRVRLALARIDPWSVMKLSFLLSIAVGIAIVVATAAMWYVLDSMHVFADIQSLLDSIGSESFIDLMQYVEFDRVISLAAVIAVVDVLLLTALATLGAFLYNIVAALVGGLHLTLTDD